MSLTVSAENTAQSMKMIKVGVTSDGSGDCAGSSTAYVDGKIEAVVIAPTSGGTKPSDAWDLTITDSNGIDILAGQGADLSAAAVTLVTNCPPVSSSLLTFTAANMGNAKVARVYVYWR